MATSLFGSAGADEMQQALINQRAEAFGQQTNEQRLGSLAYKGGAGIGQALGGMFGVDVSDPAVRRASQRQEMMRGLDASDPQALLQLAQQMSQMGDFPAAQELVAKAQALQQGAATLSKTNAETEKALREKGGSDPVQQLLRTGKFTAESVAAYSQSGNIRDLQSVDPKVKTQVVETREGQILIDSGTGKPLANIGRSPERGTQIRNEIKQAPDIVQAVSAFDKSVAPYIETRDSAQTVQGLLNDAVKSNNSQSFEAARTTLAKAIGQNKLSNEDIRRTGIDPRLVAGALDWLNKKIDGVPNEDIIKQMFAVSKALELRATSRIDTQATRTQAAAKASGFPGDPNLYFPTSTSAGTPADKEARYQAWKKTQ